MGTLETGAEAGTVGPYLAGALGEDAWARCQVGLISGGKSNLTYRVRSDAGTVVLRRPPLGHVLPTAHDMVREYRVIHALADSAVPVPAALHLCVDPSVLGAPFMVMSDVAGPIARDGLPAGYADTPAERRAIGEVLVDTLAALHSVDPHAVGLDDFGRPDGYLARQVRRWSKQWDATPDVDRPRLDALATALADRLPSAPSGPIVHGDFRLDNTVLAPEHPGRIAAVLDWEMSTLGDPLADLGLTLVYWIEPGDSAERSAAMPVGTPTRLAGFPTRDEVVARYASATGRDVSRLDWYVAFGFFKLAVVVAGIGARVRAGAMLGDGFDGTDSRVDGLVELGHETLSGAVPA